VLRKLGAYPCQNALAIALRELGKLERTLFLLEYIRDVELRRRIHIGLNKGEARNAHVLDTFLRPEQRPEFVGTP
jgi:TnpA family transposase